MVDIDREFKLLKEYMDIYIQLLPSYVPCGGQRIPKHYMPTFEDFKKNYDKPEYSMIIPHYKQMQFINKDESSYNTIRISHCHTRGMGTENGLGYRLYNSYHGCVYFTGGNIHGDYTIDTDQVNRSLKQNRLN